MKKGRFALFYARCLFCYEPGGVKRSFVRSAYKYQKGDWQALFEVACSTIDVGSNKESAYVGTISVKGVSADVKVYEAVGLKRDVNDVFGIKNSGLELRIDFGKVCDIGGVKSSLTKAIKELEERGGESGV